MNRRSEFETALAAVLDDAGVTGYRIEQGKKHRQLRFSHRGQLRIYVFPGSPSDRRAVLNATSELRRIIGRPTRIKRTVRRKRTSAAPTPIAPPETITPGPDWQAPLQQFKDLMTWNSLKEAYRTAPHGCRRGRYRELQEHVNGMLRREVA